MLFSLDQQTRLLGREGGKSPILGHRNGLFKDEITYLQEN